MMAEIKAQDVKALREKTGAGMMDCKNALDQAGGDAAKAEKILKEMGLAAVEKRVGRATNEGKIFTKVRGGKAVLLELSCETDFVARNVDFNELGARILDVVLDKGLRSADDSLLAMVSDTASKIKENMSLKRFELIDAKANECLHAYVHGDKLCVVVKFSAQDPAVLEKEPVKAFIHDVALHVAAFSPLFLDASKVPKDYVSEQEGIFLKQMEQDEKLKGKPANVLEGIAKGKMKKHLAEICLIEQNFVKDEKRTVGAVVAQVGKDAGSAIEIADFRYFRVGQ
jgi:elongation factor Ts